MRSRVHLPTSCDAKPRVGARDIVGLERTILAAVRRAVSTTIGDVASPSSGVVIPAAAKPAGPRDGGDRGDPGHSRRPGDGRDGFPEDAAIAGESGMRPGDDAVSDAPPPFQKAVAVALPGNHYVVVDASRHAVTGDLARAITWGRLLFPGVARVIASRPAPAGGVLYYVAGLSEGVRTEDLDVVHRRHDASGFTRGEFQGRVLDTVGGEYAVEAVVLADGSVAAPSRAAFEHVMVHSREASTRSDSRFDIAHARAAVFGGIDHAIADPAGPGLAHAVAWLSELDHQAFALLDTATVIGYLGILATADRGAARERAIVELFKSVGDETALREVVHRLKERRLWEALLDGLDKEVWTLFELLGKRLGGNVRIAFSDMVSLSRECLCLPGIPFPGVVKGEDVVRAGVDEFEEAARGLGRFVTETLDGVAELVRKPASVVDAIRAIATLELLLARAHLGDRQAVEELQKAIAALSDRLIAIYRGIVATGALPRIARRVKWALIWELASFVVGAGEIKAGAAAIVATERWAAVARVVGIIGRVGRVGDETAMAGRIHRFARMLHATSGALRDETAILNALGRMHGNDVARLLELFAELETSGGTDIVRIVERHPDLLHKLRRAEAVEAWSLRSGVPGEVSEHALEVLTRSEAMSAEQLARSLHQLSGKEARLVTAVTEATRDHAGIGVVPEVRLWRQGQRHFLDVAHTRTFSGQPVSLRAHGTTAAIDRKHLRSFRQTAVNDMIATHREVSIVDQGGQTPTELRHFTSAGPMAYMNPRSGMYDAGHLHAASLGAGSDIAADAAAAHGALSWQTRSMNRGSLWREMEKAIVEYLQSHPSTRLHVTVRERYRL